VRLGSDFFKRPLNQLWVAEGPKDVHALERLELTATTNAMGAGKWREHYSDALLGAVVRIIPDNDKAGRDHAEKVAASVHGKAASVKVVALTGLYEGGDVSDWIDEGGTIEELERLAEDTPEWSPKKQTELPFKTARQVAEECPKETEFYTFPFAVPGAITEIGGLAKSSGKTKEKRDGKKRSGLYRGYGIWSFTVRTLAGSRS
jgi:putative DNA primase/helicase